MLSAPSLPQFVLTESPEAADVSFQGGIQVLQNTKECPSTYYHSYVSLMPTGQRATQLVGYRQDMGACAHTSTDCIPTQVCRVHSDTHTAPIRGSAEYSHICTHSQDSGSRDTGDVWHKIWLVGHRRCVLNPPSVRPTTLGPRTLGPRTWNEWYACGHPEAEDHSSSLLRGSKRSGLPWMGTLMTLQV